MGPQPTAILLRLDAVEVDVNRELQSHWGTIHEYLTRFMTFRCVDETVAEEIAILPGMEELFSLVRVGAWAASRKWETLVIDCAPTGDTVRMLAVPEVLGFYFSCIFPIQRTVVRTVRPGAQRMTDMPIPSDDVFGAVKRVYDQMEGMGPLLQDPKRSSIRIVLNPERMVINESQRLYTYLNLFGFPVEDPATSLPETAQRLVAAARRLLLAGRFDALRLDAIAKEAGGNKASIKYYFGGKDNSSSIISRTISNPPNVWWIDHRPKSGMCWKKLSRIIRRC